MQNSLVMVGAEAIPRTWETLFLQALKVVEEMAMLATPPAPNNAAPATDDKSQGG